MRDQFHLLTHSGGTWGSSRIRIHSSLSKALSGLPRKWHKTWLPGSFTIWSSRYVFGLQIKYVDHLFRFLCCSLDWYRFLYKPSSSSTFFSGYVLFSLAVSNLITSFGFIPVIDHSVLFVLFTMLFRFLTQTVDTF